MDEAVGPPVAESVILRVPGEVDKSEVEGESEVEVVAVVTGLVVEHPPGPKQIPQESSSEDRQHPP